jgi:hypothetical protein
MQSGALQGVERILQSNITSMSERMLIEKLVFSAAC